MRVAVAADHAGFPLKKTVVEALLALGVETQDLGAYRHDFGRLSRLRRLSGARHTEGRGGPRYPALRQRRGRVHRRQQAPRHPRRHHPRHLQCASGCRARRHERHVPWARGSSAKKWRGSWCAPLWAPLSSRKPASSAESTKSTLWKQKDRNETDVAAQPYRRFWRLGGPGQAQAAACALSSGAPEFARPQADGSGLCAHAHERRRVSRPDGGGPARVPGRRTRGRVRSEPQPRPSSSGSTTRPAPTTIWPASRPWPHASARTRRGAPDPGQLSLLPGHAAQRLWPHHHPAQRGQPLPAAQRRLDAGDHRKALRP